MRQQTPLARTLETSSIVACYVSETHMQGSIYLTILRSPDASSFYRFTLRVTSDPVSRALGCTGFGALSSVSTERSPLDWIPINSRLCASWLNSSMCISIRRLKRRCLSIVSVCVCWLQLSGGQIRVLPGFMPTTPMCAFNGRCGHCW